MLEISFSERNIFAGAVNCLSLLELLRIDKWVHINLNDAKAKVCIPYSLTAFKLYCYAEIAFSCLLTNF